MHPYIFNTGDKFSVYFQFRISIFGEAQIKSSVRLELVEGLAESIDHYG
jgi:hypothetical protein